MTKGGPLLLGFAVVLVGCGLPFEASDEQPFVVTDGDSTETPPPPLPDSNHENSPPVAVIVSPIEGEVVAQGVTLQLRGIAADPDHPLSSLQARWQTESGKTIAEGTPDELGSFIATHQWVSGTVEGVTFIVTDPEGAVGSDTRALASNTPPGGVEVTISPQGPTSAMDLYAVVAPEDPEIPLDVDREESAVAFVYQWYVGGELAGIEGPLVDATLTSAGEIWAVQARAYDGFEMGPMDEATTTIGLAAPTVIVEAPFGADGALLCALQSPGSLYETDDVTWYWAVAGGAELVTTQSLSPEALHHCDQVACRVELALGDEVVSSDVAHLQLPYGSDCSAASPCFEAACAEQGGCSSVPIEGICDDGDPCTVDDTCLDGECVSGEAMACEDTTHAQSGCIDGECVMTCEAGWLDCDEDEENGCEFEDTDDQGCEG